MRLLAHFAGDVPDMAAGEFRAVFEAHGAPVTALHESPQFFDGHAEVFHDDARRILSRLGLTHVAAMHLFDGRPGRWSEGARDCCFPTGIPFAVRYVKVDPDSPWPGPYVDAEVGKVLSPGRPVNLKDPGLVARPFLLKDHVYVGQQLWESDPKALRSRHVDNRPHSSPVSLEPRLARALVNLARTKPGETLLDPFCGTGGVLIEAALLGLQAFGSDIDPDMVAGTQDNLRYFGLEGNVFESDVGEVSKRMEDLGRPQVDAVVADLPYGRSASTHQEKLDALYERSLRVVRERLRPGHYAVLGFPDAQSAEAAGRVLEPVESFRVRAHKSLTRHFVILRRPA